MFILTKFREFKNGTYGAVPGLGLPPLPALPWRVALLQAVAWEWNGLKWKVGWRPTITGGSGQRCDENAHIPPHAFALWNRMYRVRRGREKKKREGTEKKNHEHTDQFTLYPTRMSFAICCSRRSVQCAAQWLVDAGWLEVVRESHKGKGGAGIYRVLNHDEWTKKHGQEACIFRTFEKPAA